MPWGESEKVQVGEWVFYYESGNEMRAGTYDENGLRTGEWIYKYEDQTLQSRGSYVADFEDGPWTFFHEDGTVKMEGQYDDGKQSGLWRYCYAGGAPKAEGIYVAGDRVGPWQVWSESGKSRIQDFGSKAGVQLVRQVWDDTDVVRLTGALENGKPAGRWTSFHPNGRLRFCCGMNAGVPSGGFEARAEDGAVIARGRFVDGAVEPGGVAVAGGIRRDIQPGPLPPVPAEVDAWVAREALASLTLEQQLALFAAEQAADVAPPVFVAARLEDRERPSEAEPAPAIEEVVASVDAEPARQPAPAQPGLTKSQREQMDEFIGWYTDGVPQGSSAMAGYAPTPGAPRPKTGTGRRSNLEGKPLPFDELIGVDGEVVDLNAYRGKQRVMIVVLRGFLGEVCCYCVAQTKALAKARSKLEKANVEVLVIYPGARENEESFRIIYEEEFGEGPPPYRVFYDEDLELVKQLGIEGDLASPTTLLIDERGIVQYAYVGAHRADRPATNDLIELIEGM